MIQLIEKTICGWQPSLEASLLASSSWQPVKTCGWQPSLGSQLAGFQQLAASLLHLATGSPEGKAAPAGGNVFWKSPLWKRSVVSDVAMLPRNEMYKPPVQDTVEVKMNAAFTDIQEAKQVS